MLIIIKFYSFKRAKTNRQISQKTRKKYYGGAIVSIRRRRSSGHKGRLLYKSSNWQVSGTKLLIKVIFVV
jgi:hypothetical protein